MPSYSISSARTGRYWYDIRTPESYGEAVFTLLRVLPPDELVKDSVIDHYAVVGRDADIEGSNRGQCLHR